MVDLVTYLFQICQGPTKCQGIVWVLLVLNDGQKLMGNPLPGSTELRGFRRRLGGGSWVITSHT